MRRAIGAVLALAAVTLLGCTSRAAEPPATPRTAPTTTPTTPTPASRTVSTTAATAIPTATHSTVPSQTSTPPSRAASPAPRSSSPAQQRLPLASATGDARQVVTVVAASHASTTATLQAWQRVGTGWVRTGRSAAAWLGTGGIGHTSEQSTVTPEGSFTLTEAFGRYPDPGTALPYRHTTPSDWWISQPGPLYNTEQRCSSGCAFTRGAPNEHLYYATPYYNYALVIDYNRFPVRQGAGSAFFLHVTVGEPTQGCVSIARDALVRIMRWLDPQQHPRILIGVG